MGFIKKIGKNIRQNLKENDFTAKRQNVRRAREVAKLRNNGDYKAAAMVAGNGSKKETHRYESARQIYNNTKGGIINSAIEMGNYIHGTQKYK